MEVPSAKGGHAMPASSQMKGGPAGQPSLLKDALPANAAAPQHPASLPSGATIGQKGSSGSHSRRGSTPLQKGAATQDYAQGAVSSQSLSTNLFSSGADAERDAAASHRMSLSHGEAQQSALTLQVREVALAQSVAGPSKEQEGSAPAGTNQVLMQHAGDPSYAAEGAAAEGTADASLDGFHVPEHCDVEVVIISPGSAKSGQLLSKGILAGEPSSTKEHAVSEVSGDSAGSQDHAVLASSGESACGQEHGDDSAQAGTAQHSMGASRLCASQSDELRSSGGSVASYHLSGGFSSSDSHQGSSPGSYPSRPESSAPQGAPELPSRYEKGDTSSST